MKQENLEYLQKQLRGHGFGEEHSNTLKEKMEKGEHSFLLHHRQAYGNDNLKATLSFSKSDKTDMYFFNKYEAELTKGNNPEPLRQTFYINKGEDNVTLKQAYNLLEGRPVYKQLTNKKGEQYPAWMQLNFKETDKSGNYQTQKFSGGYGYDLEKELSKHPIVQLNNPQDKERLLQSLERGNRQSVSLNQEGQERKVYVEAAPQFKSLNFYDETNKRLKPEQLYPQAKEAASNEVKQEAKKDKKQDLGEENEPAKKQGRKKGMGVT